jgi:hypothetical protein
MRELFYSVWTWSNWFQGTDGPYITCDVSLAILFVNPDLSLRYDGMFITFFIYLEGPTYVYVNELLLLYPFKPLIAYYPGVYIIYWNLSLNLFVIF